MNRIKKLREEFGYTQQDLADKLEGAKSTVAMYENETRKPSLEILVKLSDIFNCSIDYLLGKSDIRNYKDLKAQELSKNYEKAINHLKEYIEKDDIYQHQEKAKSDFDKFCIEHCKAIEIALGNLDMLADLYKQAEREVEILKKRNNKAIEYINEEKIYTDYGVDYSYCRASKILKILKGE